MSQPAARARAGWAGLLLLALSLAHLPARAREPDSVAREPDSGVSGCPTSEAWQEALRARLPAALQAQVAGHFDLQLDREGTGYVGTLAAQDASSEARLVRGASCQQVADALGLIAALELTRTAPLATGQAPADEAALARDPALDSAPASDPARDPGRARFGVAGFALQAFGAPRASTDLGIGVQIEWQQGALQPWLLLGMYWARTRLLCPEARLRRASSAGRAISSAVRCAFHGSLPPPCGPA